MFDLFIPAGSTEELADGTIYTLEESVVMHFMDCDGKALLGNERDGLYHMGPACGISWSSFILRAGDMEHATGTRLEGSYKLYSETVPIEYREEYEGSRLLLRWFGSGRYDGQVLTVNWATAADFEHGCYWEDCDDYPEPPRLVERIRREPAVLEYELDESVGEIELQPSSVRARGHGRGTSTSRRAL